MARPCTICSDHVKADLARELIAAGATDQAVADRIGVNRMAVHRHRHNHIIAPTQALVRAAQKDADAKAQRADMLAAADAGEASAFVALSSIVSDLKTVQARLERSAQAAESDRQRVAVASLSAQQLRAAELRAKIGGVGGFAAAKAGAERSSVPFSINIYHSGREPVRIAPVDHRTIEGAPAAEQD